MKSNILALYSRESIERKGYHLIYSILGSIDIDIIAHFGNIPVLTLTESNGRQIFGNYNCYRILSILLTEIIQLLELEKEDGLMLSSIKDVPIGIVTDEYNRIVGFGNCTTGTYVFNNDLVTWAAQEWHNEVIEYKITEGRTEL